MCEPVSIISAGVAVTSAAYSAYSSSQQGAAAGRAGRRNALIAEMGGLDAQQRGALEGSKARSAAYRMAIRQKVSSMANGLVGAGFEDVVEGTILQGGTDAETARNNGAREAWGYENQAQASRYEGKVAQMRANNAMFGSILTGAGQAAAAGVQGWASTKVPTGGALATGSAAQQAATTDFTLKPTPFKIDYTRFG